MGGKRRGTVVAEGAVDYRILGPLEAHESGGAPIDLGGGRQRALLAILLLNRNEIVSTDRLIEWLWSGKQPATAAKIVQLYVSQLRRALGSETLLTRAPGYVLQVQPGEVDADRFEQLLGEARRALAGGDARSAAEQLREAHALRRGPALAEFRYEDFAQAEIGRLEELELGALEERVEADLALGRHADLVPELETLVVTHPLRERLRGQLMTGLYRCGRQAEALAVYQDVRRRLDEELGLEPGPALRDLERQILGQAPELAPPTRRAAIDGSPARELVPVSLRRRSAALLVAGGLLLGVGIVVAVIELTRGGATHGPIENAVARIDPASGRVRSYTAVGTTPANVAVGEGGVWVLSADDRSVSLLDPADGRLVKTFRTGGTPTELAVGDGAVWVGTGRATAPGPVANIYTASVSRIDPASTLVTRTIALPGAPTSFGLYGSGVLPSSRIAVGGGAVWAVNPDLSVSRIDSGSGRRTATVHLVATNGIAAGPGGAWVIERGTTLTHIDGRTNRVTQRIKLEATGLEAIALGAGSVWVTDPSDGLVWRVEPGPHPLTRSIAAGSGVATVAFADNAVWATSFVDGTVARIDPRTNTVTSRIHLAATPQGLAAGPGGIWTSVAGGGRGSLPVPACSPVITGAGGQPDVVIASDLPLQGPKGAVTQPMADAIGYVLREHGFRGGRFSVGYQSCDDSTARTGDSDFVKCAANAKAYAETQSVVAVIGPYDSTCADAEIAITNRLAAPLALISPSNTRPGLTRPGPAVARGEPDSHYPAGVRSYFRLAAPDDSVGAGLALLVRDLGAHRFYLLTTGRTGYGAEVAQGFRRAAAKLRLEQNGIGRWDPNAKSYDLLARQVAGTGPDAVVLADYGINSGPLIKALRAHLPHTTRLVASDGFLAIPDTLKAAGRAALGMYVAFPGVILEALGPAGRRFARGFSATRAGGLALSGTYLPEAAAAAEVVLEAIAHSDGTRASVLDALRHVRVDAGILGSFDFDGNGDMSPEIVTALRITGHTPRASELANDFRGSRVERVIRVPTALLSGSAPAS
jgi:DNA-binding SARP family transcriptional activator/ABC-type branched-subunit amino acid transport system substrate-binding protein